MSKWTLFSNHGHVLICLVKNPTQRLRDVAMEVGITERAVQKIVRDLQDVGMLSITKDGRRNRYRIDKTQPLRHALEAHCTIADLVNFVGGSESEPAAEHGGDAVVDEISPSAAEGPVSTPAPVVKPTEEEAGTVRTETRPETETKPEKEIPDKKAQQDREQTEVVSLVERQQGSLF